MGSVRLRAAGLPGLALAAVLLTLTIAGPSPGPSFHRAGGSGSVVPLGSPGASDWATPRAAAASAPAAGPTLTVTATVPTAAGLSWTASGAFLFGNYTLQQATDPTNGPWTTIFVTTSASTTSYVATQLTPGGSYWFRVSASGGLSGTSTSSPVEATVPPVAALNATLPSPTTVRLSWTNDASYGGPISFVQYGLYEIAGSAGPALIATFASVSDLGTNVTGLSSGNGYAFYVNTTDCIAGCGGGSPTVAVSESNVVTAGTPQPLVASVGAARYVVDAGQPVGFTCTPSGGSSPYAIAWDDGNGSFVNGTGTESFTFAAAGSPTVRCQVTDALATRSTAATSVTVDAAPQIHASVNRTALDVGGSIAFACNLTGGTSPSTVEWVFGDGASQSTGATRHTYGASGPLVASCTASDFAGEQLVASYDLAVSPDPVVTATSSASPAAPGTSLRFTGSASNGSGGLSALAWEFGDGGTATGAAVTHTFRHAGTFNVTARSTDSNGVTAVRTVREQIAPIAVTAVVPATAVRGGSITLSAAASGGAGGPYTFQWSFGDGSSAVGASVTHAYRTVAVVAPQLVVSDRLGTTVSVNLSTVHVASPPTVAPLLPPSWIPLIGGLAAMAVVTPASLRYYRRAESASLQSQNRWVPPTDPRRTLRGTLTCRNCGTRNNAARESCSMCGGPIRGPLF